MCDAPKINLVNMYVPPIRRGDLTDTRVQNFNPDHWPAGERTFICADISGHSPAWDRHTEEDELGRAVGEWCDGANFMAANTSQPTRQSTAEPYTLSAPVVTLHHVRWAGRVAWHPQDALSSDHRPILVDITVGERAPRQQRRRRRPRLSLAKADWTEYDRRVEDGVRAMPPWTEHTSLREANDELTRVILEAAEAAIPRGARKTPKPWWNEEVDAAVRRRNQLRGLARTDPGQGAAWREAEREVRTLIVEACRASWRDFTSQ
ncbi:hypothetical protein FJT64_020259 [Amphibalanus amphitrite]|uniref:Endonuclease/exonuclease/phosphatase domain-containing protein n=1 Tax=Amphibalanus amphitrite TaxID=1232801 RepID=A0A6A4WY02_AMPAM|nr:hypothetical protein FJT64_020259 [Amphibalanus amphitrite]